MSGAKKPRLAEPTGALCGLLDDGPAVRHCADLRQFGTVETGRAFEGRFPGGDAVILIPHDEPPLPDLIHGVAEEAHAHGEQFPPPEALCGILGAHKAPVLHCHGTAVHGIAEPEHGSACDPVAHPDGPPDGIPPAMQRKQGRVIPDCADAQTVPHSPADKVVTVRRHDQVGTVRETVCPQGPGGEDRNVIHPREGGEPVSLRRTIQRLF